MNIAKFLRTPILKNICERLKKRYEDLYDTLRNSHLDLFYKKVALENFAKMYEKTIAMASFVIM